MVPRTAASIARTGFVGWLLREALLDGLTTNMLLRLRSEQADDCLRHRAWHCGTDSLNALKMPDGERLVPLEICSERSYADVFDR